MPAIREELEEWLRIPSVSTGGGDADALNRACDWVLERIESAGGSTERVVVNGMAKNEGDVQFSVPGPYQVSYRSIVPVEAQCANLLVPVCLSASHIAYGSIRMEPVFMVLGQSAAVAARLPWVRGSQA